MNPKLILNEGEKNRLTGYAQKLFSIPEYMEDEKTTGIHLSDLFNTDQKGTFLSYYDTHKRNLMLKHDLLIYIWSGGLGFNYQLEDKKKRKISQGNFNEKNVYLAWVKVVLTAYEYLRQHKNQPTLW